MLSPCKMIQALLISTLTVQIRTQADAARERERRTAALYALIERNGRGNTRIEID